MHGFEQVNHNRIIHRGDFIDALLGVLPEGMVHLGHKLDGHRGQGRDRRRSPSPTARSSRPTWSSAPTASARWSASQLFCDKEPVFSGEHAYRAVISMDDAHGLVTDDNPRFYMGENGTIAYNLPLRHRSQLSYDITAPSEDATWAPEITNDYLVSILEGFDERIVKVAREPRHQPGHQPLRVRHRSGRFLAHRLRGAAGRRRPRHAAPPGPGRELRDHGRRRHWPMPCWRPSPSRRPGPLPGHPQAGDRRTAAPSPARAGHAEAVDVRLPRPNRQRSEASTMAIHPEIAKILATIPAPDGSPLDPAAMRAGEAAQVPPLEDRLPLHRVEDTTASHRAGRGSGAHLHADRGREPRRAGVLPRRRLLPGQPGHPRPRRPGPGQGDRPQGHLRRTTAWHPRPPSRPAWTTATRVLRWAAENGQSLGWNGQEPGHRRRQLRRHLRGSGRGQGPRRRIRRAHAPDPLLPVAGPGLRCRPLSLDEGKRHRLRPGDRGPGALQLLLPGQRRGSGRPPGLPHQARGPVRPGRRRWSSPPSSTRCATRASSTARAWQRPACETTLSRYAGANHGFVQNFSWIPEFHRVFAETGDFLNKG